MRRSWIWVAMIGCSGVPSSTAPHVRMSARDIVDASSPAIVQIIGEEQADGSQRYGTGFIVGSSGLIATNLHVIEGESKINVRLYKDHTDYPVMSVAGVDPGHDLALVWIKPSKQLPTVRLGDSNVVSAGDKIYAIGNPLGVFDYSVSDGLISQVRTLSADLTILQISAPISQGSSGGPLFNQFGEVIGVTTMIVTEGQNINLAVPGNYLRPMVKQPQTIGMTEFADATKKIEEEHGERHDGSGADDGIAIHRMVPRHPVSVWDGCSQGDIEDIIKSISDAIATGAPLYNGDPQRGIPANFEACYRIYEGTALRYEKDATCKAVRGAFGDGLLRAGALASYKEKAWAMRDTFDGLIDVAQRWAKQNGIKPRTP